MNKNEKLTGKIHQWKWPQSFRGFPEHFLLDLQCNKLNLKKASSFRLDRLFPAGKSFSLFLNKKLLRSSVFPTMSEAISDDDTSSWTITDKTLTFRVVQKRRKNSCLPCSISYMWIIYVSTQLTRQTSRKNLYNFKNHVYSFCIILKKLPVIKFAILCTGNLHNSRRSGNEPKKSCSAGWWLCGLKIKRKLLKNNGTYSYTELFHSIFVREKKTFNPKKSPVAQLIYLLTGPPNVILILNKNFVRIIIISLSFFSSAAAATVVVPRCFDIEL